MPFPRKLDAGASVTAEEHNLVVGNLDDAVLRINALEGRCLTLGRLPDRLAALEQQVNTLRAELAKAHAPAAESSQPSNQPAPKGSTESWQSNQAKTEKS